MMDYLSRVDVDPAEWFSPGKVGNTGPQGLLLGRVTGAIAVGSNSLSSAPFPSALARI